MAPFEPIPSRQPFHSSVPTPRSSEHHHCRQVELIKPLGLALLFLVVLALPRYGFANVYDYHPSSPLHLGGGFDPERPDQAFRDCISYDRKRRIDQIDETREPGESGYKTKFVLSLARTRRELYNHLQIDAKLSANYGIFSGSGSFSLEEELGLEAEDVVWILKGSTDYGRFTMNNPHLNSLGASVASDPDAFKRTCGLEFVAQERRAVMLAAVFVAHTSSESQKKRLEASFKAGADWGIGGVNASSSYKSFYQYAAEASTITVNLFALGGGSVVRLTDLTNVATDVDTVKEIIRTYIETLTIDNSVAVEYVTGSMESFDVAVTVPFVALRDYVLSEIFFAFTDLASRQSRLSAFLRSPDAYALAGRPLDDYSQAEVGIRDRLTLLYACAARCAGRNLSTWPISIAQSLCAPNGCPEPAAGECILPVFQPLDALIIPTPKTVEPMAVVMDNRLVIKVVASELRSLEILAPQQEKNDFGTFAVLTRQGSPSEILESDYKGAPIPEGKPVGLAVSIDEKHIPKALEDGWVLQVQRGDHSRPVAETYLIRDIVLKVK